MNLRQKLLLKKFLELEKNQQRQLNQLKTTQSIVPNILASLFKEQRQLLLSKSRFKAGLCGRRSGKTHTAAKNLAVVAIESPNTISCYLSLTRKSSKRIMWKLLKEVFRDYGIEAQFKESELCVELSNGSQIYLMGVKDENVQESLRGNSYKLVVLDESASFSSDSLEYLIDEVIVPTFAEHDGQLMLIGSPSFDLNSYFYKATTKPEYNYDVHHWNFLQNPFIPKAREFLEEIKKKHGYTDESPVIQREYLGYWVLDTSASVYKYNPYKNTYESLPDHLTDYVIGLDLGFHDHTACVVLACSRKSPYVYEVFSEKWQHLLPSDIANKLKILRDKYNPFSIICDEGGLGKSIAEEFRLRYGLNVKAAEKRDKRAFIEILNSELTAGHVKILETSRTAHEWRTIIFDEDRILEHPGCENHCADAFLYAFRFIKNYIFKADETLPSIGSPEFIRKQEQEMIDSWEQQIKKEQEDPFGFYS